MRLFLSSYRAGSHDQELLNFLGDIKEVGVISNAKDYHQPERRAQRMSEVDDFFKTLSITSYEIDLRPFFNKAGIEEELAKHRFIWMAGGNTFLLRKAIRQSGLEPFLKESVLKDKIVLGGDSAGALVAGPTLKGAENDWSDEDSPYFVAEGYQKDVIWEGLGYVDYVPVPHYKSGEYAPVIDNYVADLEKLKIPYKVMTDDQAIIVDGDKEEFLE